jgi:hypothetical protein
LDRDQQELDLLFLDAQTYSERAHILGTREQSYVAEMFCSASRIKIYQDGAARRHSVGMSPGVHKNLPHSWTPKRYVRTHSQDAVHAIAEAAGILRRWAIFLRIAAHGNYMEFPS